MSDLFYRVSGPETAPPMVILHGVFGSSDNWLSVSRAIAEAGFRVYLPDQRNHGRSGWAEHFDYALLAADLHDFIRSHSLKDPVVVGHSMGGKVAMQAALTDPELIGKLVVVDIAPRYYPVHHDRLLRGMNALPLETLKSRQEADEFFSQYEDVPGVRQFILKNLYRTDGGAFAWRLNLPLLTARIDAVGSEIGGHGEHYDGPTLFLRGEASGYVTQEDLPAIARLFPHYRLESIAGAGHWVQADQPEAFTAALMAFARG